MEAEPNPEMTVGRLLAALAKHELHQPVRVRFWKDAITLRDEYTPDKVVQIQVVADVSSVGYASGVCVLEVAKP